MNIHNICIFIYIYTYIYIYIYVHTHTESNRESGLAKLTCCTQTMMKQATVCSTCVSKINIVKDNGTYNCEKCVSVSILAPTHSVS